MMKRIVSALLLVLILMTFSLPLNAARTNLWEFESIQTWLQGDFKGAGLSSSGSVQPTVTTEENGLPARMVWESETLNGNTIVGSSFPSAVYRVNGTKDHSLLKKTDDLGFTALSKVNGTIYAASSPSGAIYRYKPEDQTLVKTATLSDSFVWTIIPDRNQKGLYIGTGPKGTLYHMDSDGNLSKRASVPGYNIMSLVFYNDQLHIGTDGGGIYRFKDGKITSLYGFDGGEVAALTADDQYLYAAVNQRRDSQREENQEQNISKLAEQLKQEALQAQLSDPTMETSPGGPSGQIAPQSRKMMIQKIRNQSKSKSSGLFAGLNGSIVYRMSPPERMNVVYNDREEIIHDLASDGKNLFVATGGEGRLYKVKPDFTRIAYFKAEQKLILDVQLENDAIRTITTGEGGSVHQRKSFQSGNVQYRSQVLDAQLLAQWGLLETVGNDEYQIRTRSGNTNKPDTYWSDWSHWKNPPQFDVSSPSARFFQFEVRFLKPNAQLKKLDVAFQIPNQRPRIADLSISSNPVRKQFIQNRDVSKKNDHSQPQSSQSRDQSIQGMPIKQRTISWKIIDPDGDPTQSHLYYRALNTETWVPFNNGQPIEDSEYTIDLRDLPDGHYRLKLVTTDKPFNDPKFGFTTEKKSSPILVDNTQPQFKSLSVSSDAVQFTAVDDVSRIMLAQYRINGNQWNTLWPEDNVFDQSREVFNLALPTETESGDVIEFRLLDEGGNQSLTRRIIP